MNSEFERLRAEIIFTRRLMMQQYDALKAAIGTLIGVVETVLAENVALKQQLAADTVDPADVQTQVDAVNAEIAKVQAAG